MNAKAILVLLAFSFLLAGCGQKAGEAAPPAQIAPTEPPPEAGEPAEVTPGEPEEEAPAPEEEGPDEPAAEEQEGPDEGGAAEEDEVDEEELAGLFTVETDKPLEDEGLGTETPSAQEQD